MAQEILVRFVVDDTQLEQTQKEIESLGGSIEKVKKSTKKAGSDISDSFNDAGKSADNLNGGVLGIVREIKNLAKAAKIGGAALRSALIATGVGALVVGLGLVVAYWDDISEAIGFSNKDLERQEELLENNIKYNESQLSNLQKREKLLKLQGLSTEEIRKKQEEQVLLLQEQNKALIANLEVQLLEEESQGRQLTFWQKLKIAALEGAGLQVEAAKARALYGIGGNEDQERINELRLQISKLKGEETDLAIKLENIRNPKQPKTKTEKRADVTSVDAGLEQGIADPYNEQKQKDALRLQALQEGTEEFREFQNEANLAEVTAFFETEKAKTAITADEQRKRTLEEEEGARIRMANAQAEADAKAMFQMQLAGITANALGSISQLFEEGTAASKTAAIAEIIIGTGMGFIQGLDIAQKGAKAAGPAAPFAFPIFYATQVAAVLSAAAQAKNILSKVKGGDGGLGGIGGGGSPGGQASAPSFNVVGTSGVNQLAQTLGNDETPIRAYVVGGDVTSQQEFDRNVIETSSI